MAGIVLIESKVWLLANGLFCGLFCGLFRGLFRGLFGGVIRAGAGVQVSAPVQLQKAEYLVYRVTDKLIKVQRNVTVPARSKQPQGTGDMEALPASCRAYPRCAAGQLAASYDSAGSSLGF